MTASAERVQRSVVHYGQKDPRTTVGGVETFARNLQLIFSDVQYMTPATLDVDVVRSRSLPVICDNQLVVDWPADLPVIGFQHGVAAEKLKATRSPDRIALSLRQRRAARRPNTLWVACATWVGDTFERLYGNGARHVVYYPVDTERFDGKLANQSSRLVLHDGRLKHKGSKLIPKLIKALPEWNFDHLASPPDKVADRMRAAAAFIHLSQYEGNSLVCNEAMAMNLPCLFTRVGLMRDPNRPSDVFVIDDKRAFRDTDYLVDSVRSFLGTLGERDYQPRQWVLENATIDKAKEKWREAIADFDRMASS